MQGVSRADVDRDAVLALVAEHYPVIARNLLKPLLDLLSVSREACGGDVDKFLIMLVVAIRTTEHKDFATYTMDDLTSGRIAVFPSLGTNVRSVADSVRVPRETVRRKVGELVESGWIVRQRNELRLTALGCKELSTVRESIEELAVSNFLVVADLVRRETNDGREP